MYTCCGIRDCAVEWVSLDPELLLESKMDATWYTPQSLHNSSYCESFSAASKVGADAISIVDEGTIRVDEAGAVPVVDEGTIGVDIAGAVSVVDEDATPDRLTGARIEGRKTPYLFACVPSLYT